jgi:hypothetical protein
MGEPGTDEAMFPRLPLLCLSLFLPVMTLFADPALTLLPASDSRFGYEGRIDTTNPEGRVLIWSGTRVRLGFSGDQLVLVFGGATDQSVFNVTVDGTTEIADIGGGTSARYVWPHALTAERHHLEIFKRSEAGKGRVVFRGVVLAEGAEAWAAPLPKYRLKMAFFGDSITAGACNEDGPVDQWENFRTHNYALSWAHLTAKALDADDRAMAYSGMGVITGWEVVKAGEIWDKVYPFPDSARYDMNAWQPEVAFVNLGENDDSFTSQNQKPFPPEFTAGYVKLVRAIRDAYPRAQIVLLRGGMMGGAKSEPLRQAWEAAVNELEASDACITHYVFTHFSELHPRVSDDRAMAAELTKWLEQQAFMAPYLSGGK